MENRILNKVKVRKDFPGFDEGDVLERNSSNGLFEFSHNNKKAIEGEASNLNSVIDNVVQEILGGTISLTKEQVLRNMDYFLDISNYQMQSKDWVIARVEELKDYIKNIEIDELAEILPSNVDVKESKTVWQNMIWEYEAFLGMRKI